MPLYTTPTHTHTGVAVGSQSRVSTTVSSHTSPTVSPRRILETTYWRKGTGGRGGGDAYVGAEGWRASWAGRRVACGTVPGPCAPGRRPAGAGTGRYGGSPVAGWMARPPSPQGLERIRVRYYPRHEVFLVMSPPEAVKLGMGE